MRRALLIALLFASPFSRAEAAGAIRGTLFHSASERAAHDREKAGKRGQAARPGFFGLFRPAPGKPAAPARSRSAADMRDVVVSVRSLPDAAARRLAADSRRDRARPSPVLTLADGRIEPRVIAVTSGSRVAIRNQGRLWHGAFGVAKAMKFDAGKLRPGAVDSLTFARPGLATVHCDLHPREIGYVLVLPNAAFTRPDDRGRYSLPRLPPGRYEIAVWHPERGTRTRRVEIPKRGDATCDLVL